MDASKDRTPGNHAVWMAHQRASRKSDCSAQIKAPATTRNSDQGGKGADRMKGFATFKKSVREIGDYAAKDAAQIEKMFPQLVFNWA